MAWRCLGEASGCSAERGADVPRAVGESSSGRPVSTAAL